MRRPGCSALGVHRNGLQLSNPGVAAGHLGCTLNFLGWMKRQGIIKNQGQPGAPRYLRDELD